MPLFVPIILGAVAAATAGYGAKKGYEGVKKFSEAKKIIEKAKKEYEIVYNQVSDEITFFLENVLAPIGEKKIYANELRLKAAIILKKALEKLKNVKVGNIDLDDNISIPEIEKFTLEEEKLVDEIEALKDTVKTAGTTALAYIAATNIAKTIGIASTGTAIKALSGAAARNAMLAWFGGGALSAGGGGMALGSIILGGITIGPTVLMAGLMLKKQGEKAMTEAKRVEGQIKMEIRKLRVLSKNLYITQKKVKLYEHILDELTAKLSYLINSLEEELSSNKIKLDDPLLSISFRSENKILEEKVKALYIVASTLKKVIQTQLVTPKDFKFTEEAIKIIEEAKSKLKEV